LPTTYGTFTRGLPQLHTSCNLCAIHLKKVKFKVKNQDDDEHTTLTWHEAQFVWTRGQACVDHVHASVRCGSWNYLR
jgi:hypothetical protein